jgi:ferredoxin--NADP+ reductase
MADHAIAALRTSNISEVMLLGRRGPAQAAFTNPELRELGELARAAVIVDPADIELDPASRQWLDSDQAQASNRRNVDLLRDYANRQADRAARTHRVVLRFLTSPAEILGDERVEGIRVATNRIELGDDGRLRAIPTAATEVIPCGLVLRSIGYRGEPIDDVPFDDKRGLIHNDGGRVTDDAGDHQLGEYVAGWIKRGPSGVIGTNKRCADETIRRLLEDHHAGRLNDPAVNADSDEWLRDRVPSLVTWADWERLDAHERSRGASHGRPRVKVVDIDAMTRIARGHGGQIRAAPA